MRRLFGRRTAIAATLALVLASPAHAANPAIVKVVYAQGTENRPKFEQFEIPNKRRDQEGKHNNEQSDIVPYFPENNLSASAIISGQIFFSVFK